jgi:hypothetical protein
VTLGTSGTISLALGQSVILIVARDAGIGFTPSPAQISFGGMIYNFSFTGGITGSGVETLIATLTGMTYPDPEPDPLPAPLPP